MQNRDFAQVHWDDAVEQACRQLVRLAVSEDLGRMQDWTTLALIGEDAVGQATLVARQAGVIAGLPAVEAVLSEMQADVRLKISVADGTAVSAGQVLAELHGSLRDLLVTERPLLNFVGRLSGIATLTRKYVDAVAGTGVRIYDTRKTIPGWRLLEKYAVRCGGGHNHRTGLFDAILIKDNHLVFSGCSGRPSRAVVQTRKFLAELAEHFGGIDQLLLEIEVDSLEQLQDVLTAAPDIVLLDNMTPVQLREAVALRQAAGSRTELEASGGITLETIREIAETGIERISIGALTHSAVNLDVALDCR